MKQNFLKDSVSNYLVYGLQLALGVIAIPVYIHAFGDSLYGVYLLSLGLASSLLFLEFGSGKSMLRYTAEYLADGDENKFAQAVKTCLAITGVTSLAAAGIFFLLAYFRQTLFNIPAEYDEESFWLLTITAGYAFILLAAQLPQSMLRGAGIFYVRNKLVLVELFLRTAVVFSIWWWDMSIYFLLAAELFIVLISVIFDFVVLYRKVPHLLRMDFLRRPTTVPLLEGEVFQYAKETFYLSAVGFFSQNSDRLLIGFFLDVRFVTVYTVITKPYAILKSALGKFYVVFTPYYVRILQHGGMETLKRFLVKFSAVSNFILSLLILSGILALPSLVRLWLNTDAYDPYIIYGQILVLIYTIRTLAVMFTSAMYVTGETRRLLTLEIVSVVINLAVSLALINLIGVGGVLIGTVVQLLVSVPYILHLASNWLHENRPLYDRGNGLSELLQRYLINLGLGALVILVSYFLENYLELSPLLHIATVLGIGSFILLSGGALRFRTTITEMRRLRQKFFNKYD